MQEYYSISLFCSQPVPRLRCYCTSRDVAITTRYTLSWEYIYGFRIYGKSAVDISVGVLASRPYWGFALIWKTSVFASVTVVQCNSDRLVAIKIEHAERLLLIFSVYMPTISIDNLIDFSECLSEIIAITDNNNVDLVIVLGNFNAHLGELFSNELLTVCEDQPWTCIDFDLLPKNMFESTANGALRWFDHSVVSRAARNLIINATDLYGLYMSDHLPVLLI